MSALIPAYQPEAPLLEVVRGLLAPGFPRVVVVNDGSTRPESAAVFSELSGLERVVLLVHPQNRGKGAALNTGLTFLASQPGSELGVVTVDADGQHRVEDALKVARELAEHPDSLVLGSRSFTEPCVPLGRRIGSVFQRLFVFLVLGRDVRDPQTGLRGIPFAFLPELLSIPHTGYEWETEMLWRLRQHPFRQVTTASIYIENNRSSHFHPVRDTFRLYWTLLRARLRVG